MKILTNAGPVLDRVAISTSAVCAIHCLCLPLLLSVLPAMGGHVFWPGIVPCYAALAGNSPECCCPRDGVPETQKTGLSGCSVFSGSSFWSWPRPLGTIFWAKPGSVLQHLPARFSSAWDTCAITRFADGPSATDSFCLKRGRPKNRLDKRTPSYVAGPYRLSAVQVDDMTAATDWRPGLGCEPSIETFPCTGENIGTAH